MSAPTRRAMLGALASVPAVTVFSSGARALPSGTLEWDDAITRYNALAAAEDAAGERYAEAWRSYCAVRPSEDMIDMQGFHSSAHSRVHVAHELDLDEYEARFLAAEGRLWWGRNTKPRTLASIESAREFRRQDKAAQDAFDLDALDREADRLQEERMAARRVLMNLPAPDLRALQWKLEFLLDTSDGSLTPWGDAMVAPVIADVRRLAGEVA